MEDIIKYNSGEVYPEVVYGTGCYFLTEQGLRELGPKVWKGTTSDYLWFDKALEDDIWGQGVPYDHDEGKSAQELEYEDKASLLGLPNSYTTSNLSDAFKYNSVTKPEHYNKNPYGIECIDAIKAATCDAKGEEAAFQANILKYIWRYRRKSGVEDLKKAKWYLEALIEMYENGRYKTTKNS